MSVYKRGNKWKADVYIDGLRLRWKTGFTTKTSAQRWHDKTKAELILDPSTLEQKAQLWRFSDVLSKYITEHLPTLEPSTQTRYMSDINYRIKPTFNDLPLHRIDSGLISSFRNGLREHLSDKSNNNCIGVLNNIFNKALEWEMVNKNPCKSIKLIKIQKQKYAWWNNPDDIKRFLVTAKDSRYYCAFVLALYCGLRIGEIVGLSKQDINFDQHYIHIYRQWIKHGRRYGPPKNKKERFVKFAPNSEVEIALRKAIKASKDKEIIFLTSRDKRVTPTSLAEDIFKKLIQRANVPNICFHDLRHTFASWYMIEVGDIWSLKDILGHSDIKTTQRYAHFCLEQQKTGNFNWTAQKSITPFSLPFGKFRVIRGDQHIDIIKQRSDGREGNRILAGQKTLSSEIV